MSATWTYWRVYTTAATIDHTVLRLRKHVEPIVDLNDRWFFVRYTDLHGLHVRFRVLTSVRRADELHSTREQVGAHIESDLYEPEFGKWGRANAIVAAENAFQVSSELAVETLRAAEDRLVTAALTFELVLAQLVPDLTIRAAVLKTHALWWLGDTQTGGMQFEAALARARLRASTNMPRHSDTRFPSISARTEDLIMQFAQALSDAIDFAGPQHPPTYHLHQHLHLTMNRLGLGPGQEASTALYSLALLEAGREDFR